MSKLGSLVGKISRLVTQSILSISKQNFFQNYNDDVQNCLPVLNANRWRLNDL